MPELYNYDQAFDRAYLYFLHNQRPTIETPNIDWDDTQKQKIFYYSNNRIQDFSDSVYRAKKYSMLCLMNIIQDLIKIYDIPFKQIEADLSIPYSSPFLFIFKDLHKDELLFFKELEPSPLWKIKDREPEEIEQLMSRNKASSCKYIYLVYDKAYNQIITHNDDESDPGRGYNFYSLKWFFETYFGTEEYERFFSSLQQYNSKIKDLTGHSIIKNLSPNSLVNFKKKTEHEILNYKYEQLISKKIINKDKYSFVLPEKDYLKMKEQFFDSGEYQILFGSKDFAESIVTAEWLNDSMKLAQSVDLTIIGLGYFKAVEQLLYDLMCIHKNERRLIKRKTITEGSPKNIELNDDTINGDLIDSTLGAMANFFKNIKNQDVYRGDLSKYAKNYIKEAIFKYAELRNGYFHKDNIHDPEIIKEIRDTTFELLFLLLGGYALTPETEDVLGKPDTISPTDYDILCEYINYHCNDFFCLVDYAGHEIFFQAELDPHITLEDERTRYSGIYFKNRANPEKPILLSPDGLPPVIYLAAILVPPSDQDEMQFEYFKVKKIFENGKFVGPSLIEEDIEKTL